MKHIIVIGDSRNMEEVESESVQLITTSPPYWQLKDYGSVSQIGYQDSYEKYINNLNLVWSECYRVLSPGCRMCINIGDQFARSVYYGRYKIIPIRTEIIKFCEIIGLDYMGAIIWQKVTTSNTTGGATIMGSFPYPRNGMIKIDYEFILIFKKQGIQPIVSKEQKELSKMTKDEWNTYFQGHWYISGAKQDQHLAMFPEEVPKRLIKMFSFYGETVLDPFLGSGTTALAAKNTSRNSIGIEINPDFQDIIQSKIGMTSKDMFDQDEYQILHQIDKERDFDDLIQKQPYIFVDPIQLDKKVDPNKLNYGSKISSDSKPRDEFYTVTEIINSELIKLNNGLIVRLIGIKEDLCQNEKAIAYLKKRLLSQRVYLKYDDCKFDNQNHLLSYVYLKNKTFINAHLIRTGFVQVDSKLAYRFKAKFENLINGEKELISG